MGPDEPYEVPLEVEAATCVVCPAQALRFGRFDVAAHPSPESRYDPAAGWRVNVTTGAPTCVHPYRVGLPPAPYASAGVPLPVQDTPVPVPDASDLVLPEDPSLLEAWLVATLRCASPDRMAAALSRAESIALQRFPSRDVVAAMRRVLSHELAGR
jgi:hypothetical protein